MNSTVKKILLVDDEAINALMIQSFLEKYGYKVQTVNEGKKAVELFGTENDIDLILMDIDLGRGIDGTETAEKILSKHDIPIVFLSAHTEPEVVSKTEKITSYGYVVKNSSITVLDASIKMAFKLFNAKISETKNENSLIESEKTTRWLLDKSFGIILTLDTEGNITLLNKAGHHLLGYEMPELIGKNWFQTCIPEDERDTMLRLFKKLATKESFNAKAFENRVKLKNGEYRILSWHNAIRKDANVTFIGIMSSGKDITEQKQNEEYLKKFRDIGSSTKDGIAFIDRNYRFMIVNDSFERFSGVGKKQFIGLSLSDYFGEELFLRTIKGYFDRSLGGDAITFRERVAFAVQGSRYIEFTLTPYTDTLNLQTGIIVDLKDITELWQPEEIQAKTSCR
jgi:PAS domain S-box-containing protein